MGFERGLYSIYWTHELIRKKIFKQHECRKSSNCEPEVGKKMEARRMSDDEEFDACMTKSVFLLFKSQLACFTSKVQQLYSSVLLLVRR